MTTTIISSFIGVIKKYPLIWIQLYRGVFTCTDWRLQDECKISLNSLPFLMHFETKALDPIQIAS